MQNTRLDNTIIYSYRINKVIPVPILETDKIQIHTFIYKKSPKQSYFKGSSEYILQLWFYCSKKNRNQVIFQFSTQNFQCLSHMKLHTFKRNVKLFSYYFIRSILIAA